MSDTDICCCGHIADEHVRNARGHPVECEVKDCRCGHFEFDPDATNEDAPIVQRPTQETDG